MPGIRRKQHQPSYPRLHGTAHRIVEADIETGFAELDPTLPGGEVVNRLRHSDIESRTDPALGVQMIDVKSPVFQARGPGPRKPDIRRAPPQEWVMLILWQAGDIAT